jgi:hypothetical protein
MISLREDSGDAMRSSFELEIEKMFSADGRLSAVSNYEYRPEQERMPGGADASVGRSSRRRSRNGSRKINGGFVQSVY